MKWKASWLLPAVAGVLVFGARANAALIIPTNQNGGADAEVRESDLGVPVSVDHDNDPNTPDVLVPGGVNRGSSTELATRRKDSTANSGDRSSAIYLKFDISTVPDNLNNSKVTLRLHVRNNNINPGRAINHPPFGTLPDKELYTDPVQMRFSVLGLSNFALNNWDESTITYYNAPGITPDSVDSLVQDPGKYNFNSDMTELGTFKLPPVPPQNRLAIGSPVDFTDDQGLLLDLIRDAKAAGQSHVTLVVHHGLNGFLATTDELIADPTIQTTPGDFLNFNYLFIPKEMTTLNTDTGWDADTTDPNNPVGAPFSGADNSTGTFSPKLIVVPEPASVGLLAVGLLAVAALRRRQK